MPCALHRLLPTDAWTRALLVPVLVFIAAAIDRNYQTDLWHHLARGRAIVEEGRLLDHDRFTYTVPGRAFQDANWGWQVLFYQLYRSGGLPLVQTVNALLLALTMALLLALARRRCGSLPVACGVCLLAFFGLWQLLLIRPQTFSLLLFVSVYALMEGALTRRWLLVFPPLLLAVWANVHGGFPVGLALVGCYVLAAVLEGGNAGAIVRRTWPWALCLAVCVAGTLVNPYGWRIYEYVRLTSGTAAGRGIDEWLAPGMGTLTGKVWVLSLVLTGVLLALPGKWPARRELVLACVFLVPACGSVRMVAWWLLVLTPILAARVTACWPRLQTGTTTEQPSAGAAVTCGLLIVALIWSLPWLERYNPALALPGRTHRTESDLQAVADHLTRAGGPSRVFTRFAWGEYLGWSLTPRGTVFMDGRIEIFPDDVWVRYSAVTRGRGDWQEILDGYGVDCLLLDTTGYHHDLLPLVERSPQWREELRQGDAVLFVRRGAPDSVRALR